MYRSQNSDYESRALGTDSCTTVNRSMPSPYINQTTSSSVSISSSAPQFSSTFLQSTKHSPHPQQQQQQQPDLISQINSRIPWRPHIHHPPPPLSPGLPRRFIDGVLPTDSSVNHPHNVIQYCSSGQSSPSPAGSATPVPTPRRESLAAGGTGTPLSQRIANLPLGSNNNYSHSINTGINHDLCDRTGVTNNNSMIYPPPIATRPEKTKSIVSYYHCYC
ncbi:unnamed protein product [Trichobilharzia regenti]|nr:unnamed protein product [Trichobilharzia regenti]